MSPSCSWRQSRAFLLLCLLFGHGFLLDEVLIFLSLAPVLLGLLSPRHEAYHTQHIRIESHEKGPYRIELPTVRRLFRLDFFDDDDILGSFPQVRGYDRRTRSYPFAIAPVSRKRARWLVSGPSTQRRQRTTHSVTHNASQVPHSPFPQPYLINCPACNATSRNG
jgi:hypothetical protein